MTRVFALLACLACGLAAESPKEAPVPQLVEGVPGVSIGHSEPVEKIVLSPDEKRALTFDGVTLRAWDLATGKEIKLLARFSSYFGNPATPNFQYVPEKNWLVVTSTNVRIFNASTLELIEEWPTWAHVSLWPKRSQKGFWAKAKGDLLEVGQLAPGEPSNRATKVRVFIRSAANTEIHIVCRHLIELEPGSIGVVTDYGLIVVDTTTWTVSSPGKQPVLGSDEFIGSSGPYHVPTATFIADLTGSSITPGPEGTLLRYTYPTTYPGKVKLALLSPRDLSVVRETELVPGTSVLGLNTWDPKQRILWLKRSQELIPLAFDSFSLGAPFTPSDALEIDAKAAVGAATAGANKNRWLLAAGRMVCWYDLSTRKAGAVLGDRVPSFTRIVPHPSQFEFLVTDSRTAAKRVRFTPSGIQVTSASEMFSAFAYDPSDGETIAQGSLYAGIIYMSERKQWPKEDFRLPMKPQGDTAGTPAHLTYSPDGSLIVAHSPHGVTAYELQTGNRVLNAPLSRAPYNTHAQLAAVSPDNQWLVVYDGEGKLVGYDLAKQQKAWEQPIQRGGSLIYFATAKTFCAVSDGNLQYRSAENGVLKISTPLPNALFVDAAAASPDRKRIAYGNWELTVYDPEEEQLVFHAQVPARIQAVAFLANPRYLVTAGADNLLRLWDIETKRELCSIALFARDDEWVVTTKDLRFDGSESGLSKMYVVRGADVLPLESLFEQLYTPRLLSTLLAGQKLESPTIDVKKLTAAPTIRLELADTTRNLQVEDDGADVETDQAHLRLRASANGGASEVAEVRLYQNGKLVATAAPNATTSVLPVEAALVPGPNAFKAIAVNAQRTESTPHELLVMYRPANGSNGDAVAGGKSGLRLHLLVIGVNVYQNPKYNLNYAVADATAVKTQIEKQTRSIFTGINARFILNSEANKSSIVSAFKSMSESAGPRDVFVFYYAGHGVMTSEAKPEFFLVPHDVTQLYGADDTLRQKGLSSAELLELSKTMPAQKQLFILDACQSAGALTTVAMRGAAEEKAIAQLARSTGTHWLTASGSEQFATEFQQLGHGAFTYVLLDALSGKADTGDGRVTVNELKAYLEAQVPEVTQKYKGTPQFPSSYGFGQDFPIAVVR
jgi:WD40 repeat protein